MGFVPVCLVLVDSLGLGHNHFTVPASHDFLSHAGTGRLGRDWWLDALRHALGIGRAHESFDDLLSSDLRTLGLVSAAQARSEINARCCYRFPDFLSRRGTVAGAQPPGLWKVGVHPQRFWAAVCPGQWRIGTGMVHGASAAQSESGRTGTLQKDGGTCLRESAST